MNRKTELILAILAVIIGACACVAAWLAWPPIEQIISPAPSYSNAPLTFSTSENLPIPTLTFTPIWTPTPTPVRNSQIEFFIYYDDDNNGRFAVTNDGQPYGPDYLITQAVVELYTGTSCSGTVLPTTQGNFGAYIISALEAGTYCVRVANDSVTNPGGCALIPGKYGDTKVYNLLAGQAKQDYDAGFPYICQ